MTFLNKATDYGLSFDSVVEYAQLLRLVWDFFYQGELNEVNWRVFLW